MGGAPVLLARPACRQAGIRRRRKNRNREARAGPEGETSFPYRGQPEHSVFALVRAQTFAQNRFELRSAMAAGTPSIVFSLGSMQELVEDGKTGYVVKNEEEMLTRIYDLGKINPALCRTTAHERFSIEAMVTEYENTYYKIIQNNKKR